MISEDLVQKIQGDQIVIELTFTAAFLSAYFTRYEVIVRRTVVLVCFLCFCVRNHLKAEVSGHEFKISGEDGVGY